MLRTNLFLVTLIATGCSLEPDDPGLGGQFGEESGAYCEAVGTTPLAMDEVSALGWAPADVLALAQGPHSTELQWLLQGGTTEVTVEVTHEGGPMELVDYELVTQGGGIEPAIQMTCPDAVELEVTFSVQTDDGQLAEVWTGRLIGDVLGQARATTDLDAPTGTFDAWAHVDANNDYDDLRAWLDLSFDDEGSWGEVRGQGEGSDGDPEDPDGAVWAENLDIGRWVPEGAEQ